MKEIIIPSKKYGDRIAIVDDEDYDIVSKYNWRLWVPTKNLQYAIAHVKVAKYKYKAFLMHRVILGLTDKKIIVDHKDHNGLNNQRENLRICTHSENQKNKRPFGKSKYKGVCIATYGNNYYSKKEKKWKRCITRKPYRATIVINGKQKALGAFNTEIEAAKAYDIAAKIHHGEFAVLNFTNTIKPFDYDIKLPSDFFIGNILKCQKENLHILYRRGMSFIQLSKKYKTSPVTIRKFLKEVNEPSRISGKSLKYYNLNQIITHEPKRNN